MRAVTCLLLALLAMDVAAKEPDLAQCILCHGTNANGNQAIRAPKLAGMEAWYLEAQLRAFRSGRRGTHALDVGGSEMRTIALTLPASEVTRIAQAVANLPAQTPPITVDGSVERGREIYATCAACHGERGQGNTQLRAPTLARGSDWYWAMQLNNFRNGLRGTDPNDVPGAQMRAAVSALDERAVNDVVAYVATLE